MKGPYHIDKIFNISYKYPSWTLYSRQKVRFWPPSPLIRLFMKLSGQRVLKNRQWVSVMGLRNKQWVSVTELRNRQSVSETGLRNRQSVSVTQTSWVNARVKLFSQVQFGYNKILSSKNVWVQKSFGLKKVLGPKKCLVPKF